MPEETGHFEDGRWVAGPAGNAENTAKEAQDTRTTGNEVRDEMETRINDVRDQVTTAVGGVFSLARDLFGTEKGHRHLEKKINDAGTVLESAIRDIAREAEAALQGKARSNGKKDRK